MEGDEISLKEVVLKFQEWWKFLVSKWLILLIAGISGSVLGFIYAYNQKPLYTAELTFVLEDEHAAGGIGGYASIAGQFGIDIGDSGGGGVFEGENLLALMKSRSMIEKALLTTVNFKGQKETLAEFYIRMNKLREKWVEDNSKFKNIRFLPGVSPSEFSLQQNSLIRNFHNTLIENNVLVDRRDKKSSIISLKVTTENELFSKYFTEALAKEVSEFYIETKTKKSAQNLAILQHQTDSVKRAFNSAISGVAVSTDANPNPNPARQILRIPSQSKQFDVQINQTILSQLIPNLEAAKISLRKETPLILEVDRPVLPLEEKIYSKSKGIVIGGILGGLAMMFFLIILKIRENMIAMIKE